MRSNDSCKNRRVFEKEVATALLDLANKASIERSSEDLSLAVSLVSLDEESIDAKNVYESTTKYNSLSEDINIGDFIKSSPVRCFSSIQIAKHVAIQVCI